MSSHYNVTAEWTGSRRGRAAASEVPEIITFSAPPEFSGDPGIWTPEHFFAAAVASCFVTTFKAIADFSKFEYEALEVKAEAILEKESGGYSIAKVLVQPNLTVRSEVDRDRALRLLDKAERACLVSRSIKSQIELQPTVAALESEAMAVPVEY